MNRHFVLLVYRDNQLISKLPVKETLSIGTDPRCDYVLNSDDGFSNQQFKFVLKENELVLKNLEKRFNPHRLPRLNDKLMTNEASYILTYNDQINLGRIRIVIVEDKTALKLDLIELNKTNAFKDSKFKKTGLWSKIKSFFLN